MLGCKVGSWQREEARLNYEGIVHGTNEVSFYLVRDGVPLRKFRRMGDKIRSFRF